ncbi:MAG: hypothetical protein A2499_10280 [Stygiobacter sp. RIFOXYC12_FULL_38_8]|nr:MAG: hypothetical protein A2X62_11715 [Stygiobacter sp. GWC2_38_9]OGU81543.1 MAG: hypothetical protein A2279_03770 [Stygiobacter sp. RIFOXYA12_FULL_38_9]OGV08530.1 MAG: hypothetical protein A2299_16775 [Stygiobacter sp. RIFOXYB2_FULL_37_11]OGV09980.1 MAG: hypothetical protein A2237_13685 [Stygiobacter sp. RIFOXYA2_FULL_38_8]OGV12583.1 MAG: hypothetical protein A2440_15160 [Stygiobacter sp. RIFOXYC2_FULL_38_25]OGV30004.1 MAG: hypothetical protein A2499_10280 [Stygiobacter sp. RIFOXYC12_FULL_
MAKCFLNFRLITFLFFLAGIIYAQADTDFPALTTTDITGGKISRASYFGGEALWGIIDGGADIYLEYGFDKLLLQEISWKQTNFRIEFYRMINPTSAYGIFSVSHLKCGKRDTLSKYVCITPFQVQCALGRFYVSIANDKGTKEAGLLTIILFEAILGRSKETLFEIPARFSKPEFASQLNNLKVIKGSLGFQNGFPTWSDKFEQFSKYTVYLLAEDAGDEYSYSTIIKFPSTDEMKKFVVQNPDSKLVKTKSVSDNELLYYESNKTEPAIPKWFLD